MTSCWKNMFRMLWWWKIFKHLHSILQMCIALVVPSAFRQTGNFPDSKMAKLREIFDAFGSPGDAFTWSIFGPNSRRLFFYEASKPPPHLRSSTKQGQEQVISAQEALQQTAFFGCFFFANYLAKNSLKHPEFLHILAYLYASVHHFDIWGFLSMGGTPHGWLISWKMPLKLGWFGVPLFQEASIYFAPGDQYLSRDVRPWSRRAVAWSEVTQVT